MIYLDSGSMRRQIRDHDIVTKDVFLAHNTGGTFDAHLLADPVHGVVGLLTRKPFPANSKNDN